jgi:hypothetical protein
VVLKNGPDDGPLRPPSPPPALWDVSMPRQLGALALTAGTTRGHAPAATSLEASFVAY